MSGLGAVWHRFWFAPESARNQAVARILSAGTALWILISRDPSAISGLGNAFWTGVPASSRWRYLLFPGHPALEHALVLLTAAMLVCALVGILPRLSSLVAALLLYHLAPLESIIWSPSPMARGLTMPTLALLVCAAGPSGDALALGAHRTAPGRSWIYGWPLRLLQVWLVGCYWFAALAKVRESGFGWASASNISNWIHIFTQSPGHAVYQQLGSWIADRPLVAFATGAGTLLFEFGMVVALFSKRARPWLVAGAVVFHAGIYYAMNITFNSWLLMLVFLDWDRSPAVKPAGATRQETDIVTVLA